MTCAPASGCTLRGSWESGRRAARPRRLQQGDRQRPRARRHHRQRCAARGGRRGSSSPAPSGARAVPMAAAVAHARRAGASWTWSRICDALGNAAADGLDGAGARHGIGAAPERPAVQMPLFLFDDDAGFPQGLRLLQPRRCSAEPTCIRATTCSSAPPIPKPTWIACWTRPRPASARSATCWRRTAGMKRVPC